MGQQERIRRSIVIAGGRRVLLHEPADEPRARNLSCVDREGALLWRADLPDSPDPDHYVALDQDRDAIVARTRRGLNVRLSPGTGRLLAVE